MTNEKRVLPVGGRGRGRDSLREGGAGGLARVQRHVAHEDLGRGGEGVDPGLPGW